MSLAKGTLTAYFPRAAPGVAGSGAPSASRSPAAAGPLGGPAGDAGAANGDQRSPLELLERYWGYTEFRFCQEKVINTILSGQDCLVVMPTGGGKSICYQIPPLAQDRVCIVVSPLIALMEDQVTALNARGITAAFLGSAQSSRQVKDDAWAGAYQFVYMTPELACASGSALAALHERRGIALVAIDEAHCVSEWGHDFRPDYRRLGCIRQSLPGVPLVALTATATPRVRDDIVRNLGMRPGCGRFVESFERTNLHFAVRQKTTINEVVNDIAEAKRRRGGELPCTLIYALTTKEVDEIAATINQQPGLAGRAGRYHAKMSASERREAHAAFMRDDLDVLVASVAYGMGIDKPNIRRIVHWGCPASVEAYYQQAGRAGRDGADARCLLLWSAADALTLARIKEGEGMSAEGRANMQDAMSKMQNYCHGTGCRHAQLVNFFTQGALPLQGPCRGGCDTCDRRSNGEVTSRDIGNEARLLMSAVAGLRNKFGLNRSVQLLRGSRSKDLQPWMLEAAVHVTTGAKLHGAGAERSEAWWKGLGGLLAAEGLLAYHAVNDFQVVRVSEAGDRWLRNGQPLVRELPPALQEEETRAHREAVARQRAQEERQQAASAEATELEALKRALREERKRVADSLGQAPDTLVNDLTLDGLARLRPEEEAHLRLVSGMGEAAVAAFGKPLMRVISAFMATAQHLGRGGTTDWISVARLRGSSNRLMLGAAAGAGAAGGAAGGGGGAGGAGGCADAVGVSEEAVAAARRLIAEPKGAATEAAHQWQGGMTAADIATKRPRPIAVSTALGYVAEGVAAGIAGDAARLALEAGLDRAKALAVAAAISSEAAAGIGAVKRALDASGQPVDYGAVKVVAALMASRSVWFGTPTPAPVAAAVAAPRDMTAADEDGGWGAAATEEEVSEGGGEWINLRAAPAQQHQQQQAPARPGGPAAAGAPHGKPPLPANHQQHLHPPSQLSQHTHQQHHHPVPGCSAGPGGAAATAGVSASQQSFAMHDSPVGLDGISAAPGAAAATTSTACDQDEVMMGGAEGARAADGGRDGVASASGRDAETRMLAGARQAGGYAAGGGHDTGFVFDTPARHGMSQSDTPDFIVRQSPGATTAGYGGGAVAATSTAATSTADRPPVQAQPQQPQRPGGLSQTQSSQPPGGTRASSQALANTGGAGAANGTGGSGTYRPPIITGIKRTLPGWFGAGGGKRQATGPAGSQPAAASQQTQPSQPALGPAAQQQQQQASLASPGPGAVTPAPRGAGGDAGGHPAAAAMTPGGTPVTRAAVLELLQKSPGLSAVQLAAALGCPRPPGASPSPSPSPSPDRGAAPDSEARRRALGEVLQDLVGDFEVMRRGSGAVKSQVDLDDEATTFHIL
ncbi:hypothetical protein HYH02_002897 [Chlamydomonas schloesseri]|uniref:DNA 3'-5' helicase n=1 Tax=Chlamydomonas schloesseri TaxID=2026947 RepID=A0A836BB75_9CHLO|nr:hypothetical protein HYH02_002897 [Chlamydomonas schloesseri]|eukprot:KAG2452664.1 hypothetical protein HYH02_002897 [Chlamydomonas schloesseri]